MHSSKPNIKRNIFQFHVLYCTEVTYGFANNKAIGLYAAANIMPFVDQMEEKDSLLPPRLR